MPSAARLPLSPWYQIVCRTSDARANFLHREHGELFSHETTFEVADRASVIADLFCGEHESDTGRWTITGILEIDPAKGTCRDATLEILSDVWRYAVTRMVDMPRELRDLYNDLRRETRLADVLPFDRGAA